MSWTWDQRIEATGHGCFIPDSVWEHREGRERVLQFFNWSHRWPNFSPDELRSKGNGDLRIHYETLDAMQRLRVMIKRPLIVNSYYRDPAYNMQVGGSAQSYHMLGRAVDTPVFNTDLGRISLIHYATLCGFTGFGEYPEQRFTHLDTGPHRAWID